MPSPEFEPATSATSQIVETQDEPAHGHLLQSMNTCCGAPPVGWHDWTNWPRSLFHHGSVGFPSIQRTSKVSRILLPTCGSRFPTFCGLKKAQRDENIAGVIFEHIDQKPGPRFPGVPGSYVTVHERYCLFEGCGYGQSAFQWENHAHTTTLTPYDQGFLGPRGPKSKSAVIGPKALSPAGASKGSRCSSRKAPASLASICARASSNSPSVPAW